MLLYTSKGVTATNQFKVHGQLPLHGMIVSNLRSGPASRTLLILSVVMFLKDISS